METDLTNVENMRAVGLRPTRQRLALARLLFGHGNQHMTAETSFERAQMAGIKVSLATVDNTLHQFTDAGLLRQVKVDTPQSYFDTNITDHHHFYFEDTGKIADIPHDRINQQINDISPTILPTGTSLSRVDVVVRLRGAE